MAFTLSVRSVSGLIVEPLKHIHAIPAFIILSLSRSSVQSPTKISSAFYSTCKTPISPPPSFETTPIVSFLLNECGFSLHDVNTIRRKRPNLLAHKFYDNFRQTLLYLRDKGFNEIGVRKLLTVYPELSRCSFQDSIKPKVEFLEKNGLTGEKLLKALQRYPSILSLSISRKMEPRVCFLQSLLDPELAPVVSNPEPDKITRKLVSNHNLTVSAISTNPRILASPKEKILVGLVKDVEGMGIEKGSKAFARSFIQLSMMNRDTVKRKFENLMKLGFTEEEVGILVKRMPKLLGFSENKLRQNLKFLVEEWKLPRNVILTYPMTLGLSIEKRLKPRLIALRVLMMKNKSSKEAESYPPAHYMSMSERDFHCKVVSRLAK